MHLRVHTAYSLLEGALTTQRLVEIAKALTQERNLKISFADPYIVIGQSILISKDLAGDVTSYKDLNNKKYKVASKLGTTGEQRRSRRRRGEPSQALSHAALTAPTS